MITSEEMWSNGKDRQQLGWDGIHSRFSAVQEQLWEQFKKDLEKQ